VPLFSANFRWTPYLSWGRVLLAAVALLVSSVLNRDASWWFFGALAVFLLYSGALLWQSLRVGQVPSVLALCLDTVFFLAAAGHGSEKLLWTVTVLYLFILTEAMVLHTAREVALVGGISAAFGIVMSMNPAVSMQRTVVVGGVLALAFSLNRRRLDRRIRELEAGLAEAKEAGVKAVEAERLRIASDFHDGPLQNFISLQMRLEILRKLFERDTRAAMEDLRQLQELSQEQVWQLRAFLRSMRPLDVDGSNLLASARRAAETFQKESGIPVTFVGANTPTSLSPEMAQEALQMMREALTNIQKHAGATRVAIAVQRADHTLEISIDDNGHGFNFVGSYSLEELELLKLGPASLKRRARALNADLLLDSRPGRGTGLRVRIPVP
jgi:signal transduction histidine kinase